VPLTAITMKTTKPSRKTPLRARTTDPVGHARAPQLGDDPGTPCPRRASRALPRPQHRPSSRVQAEKQQQRADDELQHPGTVSRSACRTRWQARGHQAAAAPRSELATPAPTASTISERFDRSTAAPAKLRNMSRWPISTGIMN
jgi:hypothetical protein